MQLFSTGTLVLSFLCTLACVFIALVCYYKMRSYRTQSEAQKNALQRYYWALEDVQTWCSYNHPEVRLLTDHLKAVMDGSPLNSGTPVGFEPCTVGGLREQLNRLKKHQASL